MRPRSNDNATQAAARVAEYRAAHGLIDGKDSRLIAQQISEISTQLTAARAQRIAQAARLQSVTSAKGDPNATSQVLSSPIIQQLRQQQTKLATESAALAHTYGDRTPRLQENVAQLADIDRRIATETQKIVNSVRSDYRAAVEEEAALQQQLDAATAEIERLNAAEVQLKALQQEAQASQALFDNFLQRSKETGDRSYVAPEASLISHAAVPNLPYFPDKAVLLPAGRVVSLFLGLLVVFGLEAADRGFRSQRQIENVLGLLSLGVIPELRRGERSVDGQPNPMSLIGSAMTELFIRVCRSDQPKCLSIVSSLPREGKPMTVLFLARLAAMNGRKVLIIDADLRRSGLCRALQLSGAGVSDVITQRATLDDVLNHDGQRVKPLRLMMERVFQQNRNLGRHDPHVRVS